MADADDKGGIPITPTDGPAGGQGVMDSHLEHAGGNKKPLQAPDVILNMTATQRAELEKKLVRKIDFRLLPMIVIMYILNYIDR